MVILLFQESDSTLQDALTKEVNLHIYSFIKHVSLIQF